MTITLKTLAFAAVVATLATPALAQSFSATMKGANEKPTAGDPKATGTAKVTVKGDQVCYDLSVKGLAQPTMAHIHKGAADAAGPVVVPLTPPDASGHSAACVTPDPAVVKDIAANPAGYYVNVHSKAFPAGAIRGQL